MPRLPRLNDRDHRIDTITMKREDQRRRPRLQTRQPASALVMGRNFACEVQNFCRAGLYLAFAGRGGAGPRPPGWDAGALVELQFTALVDGKPRPFRFSGTVAHATAVGAGLMVPTMPPEVFEALQAAAQRQPAGPRALPDDKAQTDPQARCWQLHAACLRRVLDEFFQDLDTPFQQAADQTLTMLEKQRLREAPLTLRAARTGLAQHLLAPARPVQARKLADRATAAPGQAGKDLALLDESEFEDWLRLTAVVNQVESDVAVSEPMARVELRYGRLTGQPLAPQSNPFGAAAACRAFHAAMRDLPLCSSARAVTYQAFGLVLGRHLPALARQLDETLAPVADAAPALRRAAAKPARAAPASAPGPDTAGPAWPRLEAASPGGAAPSAAGTAAPQRPPLLSVARDLMLAAAQQHGRVLPEAVPRESAPAAAIGAAASVFGRALAVSSGGQGIESLLKRLEQPLLVLSQRENGFPSQADHPARQVVDLLEQYAVAVDEDGKFLDPKLQRFLQQAVDRIAQQGEQDPGVYLQAREALARQLPALQRTRQSRVEQLQENCEAHHRMRLAKRRVLQALQQRLAGREVPQVVLALLQAGWRQALVTLELRWGEHHARWSDALGLVDRLLWLLSPQSTSTPKSRRQVALVALGQLDGVLAGINPLPGERETLLDDLQRALDRVAQGQPLPTVPGDAALPGLVAGTGETLEALSDSALAALALRLRVGDWWQVWKSGRWVPLQLIWRSEPVAECAFTNRSATRKLELPLPKLARWLGEGLLREGSDQAQPLLERSVQALLDEAQGQMLERAQRDPLTGLLSRKGFLQRLTQTVLQQSAEHSHLLGIIEFDQFRVVYQACGVARGEALARALAEKAQACLGPAAVLASFRDDTIALLLPAGCRSEGLSLLEAALAQLGEFRYETEGHSYSIGANLGVTSFRPGLDSAETAVQQADMACVAAKALGRNRMHCFAADDRQLRGQQDLLAWAGRIDSLLAGKGLYLRVQRVAPIAADAAFKPYHEVLLGVEPVPGQPVGPQAFVLAVEGLRRAHELDLWVLRQTFSWIRQHREVFARGGGVSINLSATSLAHAGVIDALRGELTAGDIPAELIAFEITETAAIESYAAAGDFIRQMRRYGCRFALDDFGSGHTSYGHLKNLQADALKIDGSFVKDIVDNPADYAIVKSMNDIAHSLGMRTVAEYVESPAILAKLREIGVDYAQGYAIHKPCRIEELLQHEPA
jgi:diguanylate cyclase (GGDEF)-like protein